MTRIHVSHHECVSLLGAAGKARCGRVAVGLVAMHEGHVLLVRRSPDEYMGGIWEIPAGKVREGESLFDAIVRKAHEELRSEVLSIDRFLSSFDWKDEHGVVTRQLNFVVHLARHDDFDLTKHDACAWVTLKRLDDLEIDDVMRTVITTALLLSDG